jgi:hypothetical protein
MDGDGNNFPLLTNKFSRAVSRDVSSLWAKVNKWSINLLKLCGKKIFQMTCCWKLSKQYNENRRISFEGMKTDLLL